MTYGPDWNFIYIYGPMHRFLPLCFLSAKAMYCFSLVMLHVFLCGDRFVLCMESESAVTSRVVLQRLTEFSLQEAF